jgi:signal transduction histidine kinase
MLKLSSEKEMLSRSILNFYSDPNQRKILIQRLKKEGQINGFEVRWKRVDKTEFWGSISATRVVDKNGEFIHIDGIVEDISQRKNAVEEKLKLERQLRQAQKMEAIGTLAGGIAHDFNNILSAIIGFTELAQYESGSDNNSRINEHLEEVLQAGKRAKELVKQILAFSRQGEQDIRPIHINVILKETLKLIRASLPSTIEIVQDIRDDVAIMGDPTQIHQVIMNLCTNAAHAMQNKGGILQIQLKLVKIDEEYSAMHVGIKPGTYINLVVSDTGHGMPSHVLERIFEPFFTTKKNGEGTGMGLSVVHGIIKSHGGLVTVYSHQGKGSTFNIVLPRLESVINGKHGQGNRNQCLCNETNYEKR